MVNDRRKLDQRKSEDEPDKRRLNTKLDLALDQNGRPIRAIITESTTADCSQAEELKPGIQAQYLLADRGYDSQAILPKANQAEMRPVIPPQKKRKYQRNYNQD